MSELCNKSVLVLNSAYEPLNVCSARRAMTLIVKGVARAEETRPQLFYSGKMWDERTGESVTVEFYLPSVIRLLEYRYIPIRAQIVTRKNILNRDGNKCMYCGKVFSPRHLTLDHIVPRSKGGKSTWENLVASCMPCNKKKGDSMLQELSDIKLLRQPPSLNKHTGRFILRNMGADNPVWEKYLFFNNETDEKTQWNE